MIGLFNSFIASLGAILQSILLLLPPSPFDWTMNLNNDWLRAINWIFPVSSAIAHLELYVLAVATYFGIRIVLRWTKAVSS